MKKFIRKILSIVLAVIMIFTVIPLTGTYLEARAIDSRVEAAVQTAIGNITSRSKTHEVLRELRIMAVYSAQNQACAILCRY